MNASEENDASPSDLLIPELTQQLVRLLPAPGARSDWSPLASTYSSSSSSSHGEDRPRKLRKNTYAVRKVSVDNRERRGESADC